ncbi:MAG TPA: hypothetical protein VEC58_08360 [Roseiarcus sp.]|nr:hypothetical protein [Roseiarcus sp.]
MKALAFAFAALLALGASAQAGGIVVPAEQRYSAYSGVLPPCEDEGVLAEIASRFATTQSDYWASSLQIRGYDQVREIGYRANGLAYIPRRYCVARATLNDDSLHLVVFQIQENLGFVGFGRGVEWCVVGLDRNLAYAPACLALRPYASRFLGEKAVTARY